MPLELHIVTPSGETWRGSVESVVLPGSEGDFGVLPNHERFLTPLRIGEAEIRTDGKTLYAAISEGFADVQPEAVTVLVESAELAGDIDKARAERARERLEQHLAALAPDADRARYEEFESALERAKNRIAVAERR